MTENHDPVVIEDATPESGEMPGRAAAARTRPG